MKNKSFSRINIEKIFKAKEKLHRSLAKLPFEEKISILFRLQEIANSIGGQRRKQLRT